jgi:pimeloyl-ACP methyl ester carboxylesterase
MIKTYGKEPYKIVLVHGGPGAAGEMESLAKIIPAEYGILEPYQSQLTIDEQIEELKEQITNHTDQPVVLIGYSWGAWLSFLLTARYNALVEKLILVSSGPFKEQYVAQIMMNRLKRLNGVDKKRIKILLNKLNQEIIENKEETLNEFKTILSKADHFKPLRDDTSIQFDERIYNSIWTEASKLRKSGKLLKQAESITVDVTAIHGDYDPHPYQGVKEPLEGTLEHFRFILLDNCGHKPWIEQEAKDEFVKVLLEVIDHN